QRGLTSAEVLASHVVPQCVEIVATEKRCSARAEAVQRLRRVRASALRAFEDRQIRRRTRDRRRLVAGRVGGAKRRRLHGGGSLSRSLSPRGPLKSIQPKPRIIKVLLVFPAGATPRIPRRGRSRLAPLGRRRARRDARS